MTPNAAGRHCLSCAKTVTDFSVMTDEAIQQYFIQHHTEPVCGRFKNEQLHRIVIDLPHNVFQLSMPFWKKFLVAVLIVFSASVFPFETTIAGKKPEMISYYSADTSSSPRDKKPRFLKKKKHRRYKILWPDCFTYPIFTPMVAGFTQSYPVQPSFDPFAPAILYPAETTKKVGDDISEAGKSPAQKKEPPPAAPFAPEFILPAILLKKRKNLNTTMD